MTTVCNSVKNTKAIKTKRFWESFRCICIYCKNVSSIEVAIQELSWGGGGGGEEGTSHLIKIWVKNTLARVKLSWNEVQGAVELIISCTEVLTLFSDEHSGNVEFKWKKEF